MLASLLRIILLTATLKILERGLDKGPIIGIEAVKQVDPNMVIKKRKGKEAEVQEGWKGHILPFSLVQKYYFPESFANIEQLKNELQEISSAYEEILEGLNEDEQVMLSPVLSENKGV